MHKTIVSLSAMALALGTASAIAQPAKHDAAIHRAPKYRVMSELSKEDVELIRTHAVSTVPTFNGSFSYQGKSYDYIIVGGDPAAGGTTTIPTAIQPVKMIFDGTTDPKTGQPYVLDGSTRVNEVLNSPNFQPSNYTVGNGIQFQDAVQIAQFWSTKGADYHTVFGAPRVLPTQTVHVPANVASILTLSNGAVQANVSIVWWYFELWSIRAKAGFKTTEVPLVLTDNVVMYELTPAQCCVVGFHMAYKRLFIGTQTLAWASYVEPGYFGDTFLDVTAISHELAELINDPFVSEFGNVNTVPAWEFPGETRCQGNLETGDPIEVLANATFPVAIGNTTYHPQNEALLQWFERKTPSDAFNGAYSYPDTTALTTPAKDCGT